MLPLLLIHRLAGILHSCALALLCCPISFAGSRMNPHVTLQVTALGKYFTAHSTAEHPRLNALDRLCVATHVLGQSPLVHKGLAAHGTRKGTEPDMASHMDAQRDHVRESFGANVALVRPDTVVALLVHLELAARRECARTAITGERLLAGVRPHVLQHIAFLRK